MFFKSLESVIREFPYSIRGDCILLILICSVVFGLYVPFNYKNMLIYGTLKNIIVLIFLIIFYIILYYIVCFMVIFLSPW